MPLTNYNESYKYVVISKFTKDTEKTIPVI